MTWVRVFSEGIMHPTVFGCKVPGVDWALGITVPVRKPHVKFKSQLGLYHDCAFMLI